MKTKLVYRIPWGILAGAFAILDFYLILSIVTVNIVSNAMIAEAGGDDGLSQSWWIPLVIGLAIAVTILVVVFTILYFISNHKKKMMSKSEGGK